MSSTEIEGIRDCGLFALAFATSLCNGICPTAMVYNQQSMRKHLLQCLVNGKMTEFPGRKRKPRTKKSAIIPVHVFCKRRQPECGEMAECDQCHEWFHKKCESIPDMVWLQVQLKSNMVLRAVNAVLTRTLHAFV